MGVVHGRAPESAQGSDFDDVPSLCCLHQLQLRSRLYRPRPDPPDRARASNIGSMDENCTGKSHVRAMLAHCRPRFRPIEFRTGDGRSPYSASYREPPRRHTHRTVCWSPSSGSFGQLPPESAMQGGLRNTPACETIARWRPPPELVKPSTAGVVPSPSSSLLASQSARQGPPAELRSAAASLVRPTRCRSVGGGGYCVATTPPPAALRFWSSHVGRGARF